MTGQVITLQGSEPIHPDNAHSIFKRIIKVGDGFVAPRWIIDGCIPEGVGVIAGAPGVGKTSALIPLLLRVAGIASPDCNLECTFPRKVILFTEDDAQVILILNGMRHFLRWDDATWEKVKRRITIVGSMRVLPEELEGIMIEAQAESFEYKGLTSQPLMVFDTSSANFELQNESDNSQVSAFMAVLKQSYSRFDISSWVVSHTPKTQKGVNIDAMFNASARGASSFEGDAQWTAILSSAEENNEGPRVLKLGKRRVTCAFDEIIFEGSVQHATAIDRFGEEIVIDYRYTVARRSSKTERDQDSFRKKSGEITDRIIEVIADLDYPSRNQISDKVGGSHNLNMETIKLLILNGVLLELNLPAGVKLRSRSTYIAIAPDKDLY